MNSSWSRQQGNRLYFNTHCRFLASWKNRGLTEIPVQHSELVNNPIPKVRVNSHSNPRLVKLTQYHIFKIMNQPQWGSLHFIKTCITSSQHVSSETNKFMFNTNWKEERFRLINIYDTEMV